MGKQTVTERRFQTPLVVWLLCAALASLAACSDSAPTTAPTTAPTADLSDLIRETETLYAEAQIQGRGWNITEKYLAAGKHAATAGNPAEARKQIERALLTVRASIRQGAEEESAWSHRFRFSFNMPEE